MAGLTTAGDDDEPRAVLGFTEADGQPVGLSPIASSRQDAPPINIVSGYTGSGKQQVLSTPIPTPAGWTTMGDLQVGDAVLGRDGKPCRVVHLSPIDQAPRLYRLTLSDGQQLIADGNHQWVASEHRDRASTDPVRRTKLMTFADQLDTYATHLEHDDDLTVDDEWWTIADMWRHVTALGDVLGNLADLWPVMNFMDVPSRRFSGQDRYLAVAALRALAHRVRQRYGPHVGVAATEQVVTTAEMLAAGTAAEADGPNWAIRVTEPINLPEFGFGMDPYNVGHRALDTAFDDGVRPYLRGSREQRLAALQGLMDRAGLVSDGGVCEVSLLTADRAGEVAELVRSLGIVASTPSPCRVVFTTTEAVFRDPEKLERLPKQRSDESGWLYIESIEPVLPGDDDYEPARCIQVDSPDSTYLCAGFIPTHNTLLLQWLAAQFAEIPTSKGENTPVVVINPKSNSDLSKMVAWVQARTGQGQVYNLDNLLHADGVFDPIRFSRNPEVGLEMALNAILAINPFGPHKSAYELPLTTALRVGITAGATCIGQALEIAAANGAADPGMVQMVLQLADAIPKARAIIGRNPNGNALSVAGGLTLIQAGETSLSLDDTSEHVDMSARVDRTLLRLMVQGSAAALANRDGVVMFDEAWVFTKGAGSAMEALGRTAREMRVMMMMFNQRPSEMLGAGLENYISRSFTMSLPEKEARAACEIAKLEPTEERIGRLTDGSMGHVIGPDRTVYKGSRGIFVGLDERPVVVEVVIPKAFFEIASTNAAEKDAALAG